jgi:hypothetical protein
VSFQDPPLLLAFAEEEEGLEARCTAFMKCKISGRLRCTGVGENKMRIIGTLQN